MKSGLLGKDKSNRKFYENIQGTWVLFFAVLFCTVCPGFICHSIVSSEPSWPFSPKCVLALNVVRKYSLCTIVYLTWKTVSFDPFLQFPCDLTLLVPCVVSLTMLLLWGLNASFHVLLHWQLFELLYMSGQHVKMLQFICIIGALKNKIVFIKWYVFLLVILFP